MKSDPHPGDPNRSNPKGKPPEAAAPPHDADEIVELGELPDVDPNSGEISRSQQSGPLSGTSVVTWDQLMRAKSEADIQLDFDSLHDVEIDSASDRDLLKNMTLDEPPLSTLEHSSPAEEFAEVGKGKSATPGAEGGDFTESSIFAPSAKSKRGDESEVDLLAMESGSQPSSFDRSPKTDEITPPKIHGGPDESVTDDIGAAILRGVEGSAVDLGSESIVDLPYPLGGDSAAKLADSSRRRRLKIGESSSGGLDDSGAVDLLSSEGGSLSVPGLTAVADSASPPASMPSTRRMNTTGNRATSWVGGGLVGALTGVAVCFGVWLTGAIPSREPAKQQQPTASQPPVVAATPPMGLSAALGLLDSGDLDRAVEQLDKVEKTNVEARTALGQARVLKYLRDCKQKNAQPDAAAEELKAAQADLKTGESAVSALWLGLIEESFGKSDTARTIYQEARGKFANDAKLFQAALDRLDARPTGPASPKVTMNSFGAVLFTLLIQAEPAVPDEAGFEFWKAVRLAKQHKYSEAQTALKQARDAHDARRFLLARKGLNPTSDPLEETFLRCCDELRDYWTLRNQLHTGGYDLATQTSPTAALMQALNRGRNDAEEVKSLNKRLAAIKDALSQSGYDLNDLPAAVNKFVKAKETVDAALKTAQTDKATAEARQQAAVAQVGQAEAAKKIVEDELQKTRDQLAAMKPATGADADVAKLRENRQKLEAKAKDLEDQLTSTKQSAERSQTTARELMNFVTAVKQKIQSPPEAKPNDVLTNLDRALAARSTVRVDLPAVPTAATGDPRAERAFAQGLYNYRAGDIAMAEADFATAVQFNGLDARYWYFLGLCKATQGREAGDDFRQGVERERRNLPNAGTIDASLERLSPDARLVINRARGR
jgi:tetratricopeptide (TPR) repeat protein